MSSYRILIADDHPIFLNGICRLIELKYPEIEIVATASNGQIAVEKTRLFNPDVLVIDIRMPVMDGISAIKIIKSENPQQKIIILTTFDEQDLISSALGSGANAYLLKESSIDDVVDSIREVCASDKVLMPESFRANKENHHILLGHRNEQNTEDESNEDEVQALHPLSHRELEVLKLMAMNYSNEMIGEALSISQNTVRNYVSKIYEITRKENRSKLILWAMKIDLLGKLANIG